MRFCQEAGTVLHGNTVVFPDLIIVLNGRVLARANVVSEPEVARCASPPKETATIMSQDHSVHLEQVSVVNLIQRSLVRVVDELNRTFTKARRSSRTLIFGSGRVAQSSSVLNQAFQAIFDSLQALINVGIRRSLRKSWIIVLLKKTFKSENGIQQLVNDLQKIVCSKKVRIVDQLSELRKVQPLEILDSRFKRIESWLVSLNLSRCGLRINVEFNQSSISATNLRRIVGDVVERLADTNWLHLVEDRAIVDVDGDDRLENGQVVCRIDWKQVRNAQIWQRDRFRFCIQSQHRPAYRMTLNSSFG